MARKNGAKSLFLIVLEVTLLYSIFWAQFRGGGQKPYFTSEPKNDLEALLENVIYKVSKKRRHHQSSDTASPVQKMFG
jgi:hypothetical protein